jgi:hypothetical protein
MNMKTAFATLTAAALVGATTQHALAGDREWATAGKILTGVVAASVISKAFEPVPVYHSTVTYAQAPTVVYTAPPPVIVQPAPAPLVVQQAPAPTVVYQQPVYVQPAPVYVVRAPVYVARAPVYVRPPRLSVHVGFGHRHHRWVGCR